MPYAGETNLYCYLPTNVATGLPFIVNADFSLNQKRTSLLNNSWNQFLFKKIASWSFGFLAKIAKDTMLMPSMLNILPSKEILNLPSELKSAYQQGYNEGVAKIAFLPSLETGKFLSAKEAIVDETGFFHHMQNKLFDPEHKTSKKKLRLVNPALKNQQQLQQLTQ
ncbi:MAG: hypothetical protein ACK4PR_06675, partial [Gammaproteobacteria bacterium]